MMYKLAVTNNFNLTPAPGPWKPWKLQNVGKIWLANTDSELHKKFKEKALSK